MMLSLPSDLVGPFAALLVFTVVTGVALGFRRLAFRALYKWAAGTKLDEIVLRSLRLPSIAWAVLIGVYVAVDTAHLSARPTAVTLNFVYALLVLSVTAAIANFSGALLDHAFQEKNLPIPATGLSLTIFKTAIWLVGVLVLLSSLGVSITPILTALGVGGLAVALALQETLSNFFAGLHLLLARPFRVGDFVRLETGQEGYVLDIGWRATKLRMLPNNVLIVPNSKMAQSIVTNYYLPEPRMSLLIQIGVSYDADPEQVERILLEEAAQAVGQVPGLLGQPAPMVRFIPGFGESSLDFTLICQVREFTDQYLVQHELRKRIFRRLKKEGIEIPFPQRTVHLRPGFGPPYHS